ncbi:sugar transporter [Altererythrobacter indicus]|uniref:Sugar transporter n=1 Tax=Altericroceibacterium indicum TaxID=374177 RepID=A0A845A8E6_9SPHN|nr:MFS transporter [Altericroceibacterium indicum]MXP25523.1 sugar transporter [Altericroceibacterium indicum]
MTAPIAQPRPGIARIALFGAGDFACNLYWQAITLYLLIFYIDTLKLPPATAAAIYMVGAIWDGLADLLVGALTEHRQWRYRRLVAFGATPLGLAFAALYALPALTGGAIAVTLGTHVVFRTFYALVNVPYASWSVRISAASRDRTLVAGFRMGFGALAAFFVALGTPWLANKLGGAGGGLVNIAALLAMIGTPLLLLVAYLTPEIISEHHQQERISPRVAIATLFRNRAFVSLNAATACAALAAAVVGHSVLFYFRHTLNAAGAGSEALAAMGIAALIAIPGWTWGATRIGTRASWFVAGGIGLIVLALGAMLIGSSPLAAQIFLFALQIALAGFSVLGWAMLPDTVEYGEAHYGVRVEAMAFACAALVQKLALAFAALLIGLGYDWIGYSNNGPQTALARDGIAWIMFALPAIAIGASLAAMLTSPLRRGTHRHDLAIIAARNDAS